MIPYTRGQIAFVVFYILGMAYFILRFIMALESSGAFH